MDKQSKCFSNPGVLVIKSFSCFLDNSSGSRLRQEGHKAFGILAITRNPLIPYSLPIEDVVEMVNVTEGVASVADSQ